MKKLLKNVVDILVDLLIILILILSASLFAEEQSHQPADTLAQQVTKLKQRLQLTEEQTANLQTILKKAEEQALKDRNTFKTNAVTLVELAWERREATNLEIDLGLTPDQKEEFKKMKSMTPFDRELFDLTEGLLLDSDQAFTVEGILIDYYNALNEMMPEEMRERVAEGIKEPERRQERPAGMGMGMMKYGGFKGIMKELRKKKERSIKKILTKEQKQLYQQLSQHRKEQMKKILKPR